MKIIVTHASIFDYEKEFYEPLKKAVEGTGHELIFPPYLSLLDFSSARCRIRQVHSKTESISHETEKSGQSFTTVCPLP